MKSGISTGKERYIVPGRLISHFRDLGPSPPNSDIKPYRPGLSWIGGRLKPTFLVKFQCDFFHYSYFWIDLNLDQSRAAFMHGMPSLKTPKNCHQIKVAAQKYANSECIDSIFGQF